MRNVLDALVLALLITTRFAALTVICILLAPIWLILEFLSWLPKK